MHDLLACKKYAFVTIFTLDCVLVSDLLYGYKPKYKDIYIVPRSRGIVYFSIGHYSVPGINYDNMQYPGGRCVLKNKVNIS